MRACRSLQQILDTVSGAVALQRIGIAEVRIGWRGYNQGGGSWRLCHFTVLEDGVGLLPSCLHCVTYRSPLPVQLLPSRRWASYSVCNRL